MREFIIGNKVELAVFGVFIILMLAFTFANPDVFLAYRAYTAVFTTVAISIIITVAMVFVIAGGEIDLSFPSLIGISAWAFASTAKTGISPLFALLAALTVGTIAGLVNGLIVTRLQLSSLVSTLGMNFLLRGLIMIGTQGLGISLVFLKGTILRKIFVGRIGLFPVQMIWSIAFTIFCWILFYRHKFGGHVCYAGDNLIGSREMGINVERVKLFTFMLVGFSAAFSGTLICLINNIFWPTAGDGYLLMVLGAVFLGGTPTWGGIGTIFGAFFGALILGFIETGIIASGLTGFYTQFFYGVILILSLISHRFAGLVKQ
jgi:ribose/xylose/arabinose/galactoside ABC-type transport system permease subunit